jgi:hypothetical protein
MTQFGQQGAEALGQFAMLESQKREQDLALKRQQGLRIKNLAQQEIAQLQNAIAEARRAGRTDLAERLAFRFQELDRVLNAPDEEAPTLWEEFSKPKQNVVFDFSAPAPDPFSVLNPPGETPKFGLKAPQTQNLVALGRPVILDELLNMTPAQRVSKVLEEASAAALAAQSGGELANFLERRLDRMPEGATRQRVQSLIGRWAGGERSDDIIREMRETAGLITTSNSPLYQDAISFAQQLLTSPLLTEQDREQIKNDMKNITEGSTVAEISDFKTRLTDLARKANETQNLTERAREMDAELQKYASMEEVDDPAISELRAFYAQRWRRDNVPPEEMKTLIQEADSLLRKVPGSLAITARARVAEQRVVNFLNQYGAQLNDADRERLTQMVADGRVGEAVQEAIKSIRGTGNLEDKYKNLLAIVESYNDYVKANPALSSALTRIKQDWASGDLARQERAVKDLDALISGSTFGQEAIGKATADAATALRARRYEVYSALSSNLAQAVAKGAQALEEELKKQVDAGLMTKEDADAYRKTYLAEAQLNDKYIKAEKEGRYMDIVREAVKEGDIWAFNRYYGLAGISEEQKVEMRKELEQNKILKDKQRLLDISKIELEAQKTRAGIALLPATIATEKTEIASRLGAAGVELPDELKKDPVLLQAWTQAKKDADFDKKVDAWRFDDAKKRAAWQDFEDMVKYIPSNPASQVQHQRGMEKKLMEAGYSAAAAAAMAQAAIEGWKRGLDEAALMRQIRLKSLEEQDAKATNSTVLKQADFQLKTLAKRVTVAKARLADISKEIGSLQSLSKSYRADISGSNIFWYPPGATEPLTEPPPEVRSIDNRIRQLLQEQNELRNTLPKYEAAFGYIGQVMRPLTPDELKELGFDNPFEFFEGGQPNTSAAPANTRKNIPPELVSGVQALGQRLKVDPNHLMAVISFETKGTFDPSIQNPNSSAIGLFQITDVAAKALGYKNAAEWYRANPTIEAQLQSFEKYLRMKGVKPGASLSDIYVAVTGGAKPGAPDSTVIYSKDKNPEVYRANAIWDVDKDGVITKGELAKALEGHIGDYFPTSTPTPAPATTKPVVAAGLPLSTPPTVPTTPLTSTLDRAAGQARQPAPAATSPATQAPTSRTQPSRGPTATRPPEQIKGFAALDNLLSNSKASGTEAVVRATIARNLSALANREVTAEQAEAIANNMMRVYGLSREELGKLMSKYGVKK